MKNLFQIAVLFLLGQCALGQEIAPTPFRFTNYRVADGLPSNVARSILQDSRGFIWISTAQGLARFDGHNFTVYNHNRADTNSMPCDDVGLCIELKNHHLLFTNRSKLWMLNPFNHEQYAPPIFWKSKNIIQLYYLNKNLIGIVGTEQTYFTDINLELIDSVRNPLPGYIFLHYLGNNKLFFSNFHKSYLYSLLDRKMAALNIKVENFCNLDGYGVQWVDTTNSLLYLTNYFSGSYICNYNILKPKYLEAQLMVNLGNTTSMLIKDDTTIALSDDKLYIFQKDKAPVIFNNNIANNNNLPGGDGSVYADNQNNFWVTGQNGISRFNLNRLNYQCWKLPYRATLQFDTKYNGKIWMRSSDYGSLYFDPKLKKIETIDSNIIRYCWGVVPINNQMYVHGNGHTGKFAQHSNNVKLLSYNTITKKITAPTFLKPYYRDAELITMIFQSKNGDIWYSLNKGNGLIRQKANTTVFEQYRYTDNPAPFSFSYVNMAAEDTMGNIYFTVNKRNEILVWKNKEGHFEEWKGYDLLKIPAISFGSLVCHIIDSKQNLWLAYDGTGLMRYNLVSKIGKLFEIEDGLPANIFGNVIADVDDNIWIPTIKGLVCLVAGTNKFLVFTEQDGLPFSDFFEKNIFYDRDDSSLYFGAPGCLYKIKTGELLRRKQQNSIKLYIDRMNINNQPYYFANTDNITLNANENNIQFSFNVIDFNNAVSNKNYEYALTSDNNKPFWQKLNGTNNIVFNQLNPGSYQLQVRIIDETSNLYIDGSNRFHFTIDTPWKKSWWFISLVCLLILLAVWAIIRGFYLRRIEKQKGLIEKQTALVNERSRIASDMHDDLGAGLSRIRYMSAGMKNEIQDARLIKEFDKIIKGSDELVDKMNEIIWALNSSDEKLEDVLYYIRSQCSEMLDEAGIELQATLPDKIPKKILNSEEKRNLFLVIKEAVHNIIKHAQASSVRLVVQIETGLHITITDNGRGFNVIESRLKGNGLGNYIKRMNSLKGNVDIKSDSKGTTLQFTMPL